MPGLGSIEQDDLPGTPPPLSVLSRFPEAVPWAQEFEIEGLLIPLEELSGSHSSRHTNEWNAYT